MKNFVVTMAVIAVMILAINWVLKDYIYYRRVANDKNLASTERYLKEFPGGFFADEVREQHEEYSFLEAKANDSKEDYDKYINEFGNSGKYFDQAIERSEELHYQELKERADLEEVIRYLKRPRDSKFKVELEQLESELWVRNRNAFLTYARNNGYSPSLVKTFNDIFSYMQENRFTRFYISANLDKEFLKDWNDYPAEVRLLWDDSTNLVKTFDSSVVLINEELKNNDSTLIFPHRTDIPSEFPPFAARRYISKNKIRKLYASFPSQIIAELENSGVKFPIFHAVRNASEIPREAPAFILNCIPVTRETKLNNIDSPVFSMLLRKRTSPQRVNEEYYIPIQFNNGYMMEIDVKWNIAYNQGQELVQEIFSATYSPNPETHFFSKGEISSQYTEMIGNTFDQFKTDLARNTVFDLGTASK